MRVKKHIVDLTKISIGYVVANIMKLKKNNRDVWLISERRDEAEDNGYHLYKYIRENHQGQKVYYIIDKKSKAYKRIKKYKTIIQHNSLKHYIYYFLSDKHISAFQFFGVPETPFLWRLEKKGIIRKKKIFLQHGITQSNLSFLKYNNTQYRLFVCGAKNEYEYIKKEFGYPKENLEYLGFCRFDNLHNYKEKNQILIMPTWRQWLGMTSEDRNIEADEKEFLNSNYFKTYNSLINNDSLDRILEKNNIKLLFYPHPEMQRFIKFFKCKSKNIKITRREENNLQELLKESKMLITDYSSIAFDFAYMKKPLIYYQFDKDIYYKNHFKKGYFDCERDGFGPVITLENELIKFIGNTLEKNIDSPNYVSRSEKFFEIHDINNCKRTYEKICNI